MCYLSARCPYASSARCPYVIHPLSVRYPPNVVRYPPSAVSVYVICPASVLRPSTAWQLSTCFPRAVLCQLPLCEERAPSVRCPLTVRGASPHRQLAECYQCVSCALSVRSPPACHPLCTCPPPVYPSHRRAVCRQAPLCAAGGLSTRGSGRRASVRASVPFTVYGLSHVCGAPFSRRRDTNGAAAAYTAHVRRRTPHDGGVFRHVPAARSEAPPKQ